MSLDTGAVIADPFEPTAHLVELLRTAARPAPAPRAPHPPLRAARGSRRLDRRAPAPAPSARGPTTVRLRPVCLAA